MLSFLPFSGNLALQRRIFLDSRVLFFVPCSVVLAIGHKLFCLCLFILKFSEIHPDAVVSPRQVTFTLDLTVYLHINQYPTQISS